MDFYSELVPGLLLPVRSAGCNWQAGIMAEQPVQRSYWPEKAIDWLERA